MTVETAPAQAPVGVPDAAGGPEVVSAEWVARRLGVNVKTVYTAARTGEIPARRLGRRFIFVRQVIETWLATAPESIDGSAARDRPGACPRSVGSRRQGRGAPTRETAR